MAIDRIADPWGTRTPYEPGTEWPERIDTYPADGIAPESVDRWVQSAAVLHSNWANAMLKELSPQVLMS